MKTSSIRRLLLASAVFTFGIAAAAAQDFNVPAGDLKFALDAYSAQTGTPLIYPAEAIRGIRTSGAKGPLSANDALSRILSGTGFAIHREEGAVAIVRQQQSYEPEITPIQVAQAAPARAAVETVTVTSSKLGGADVQSIPISITALSQEQLTASQTNGGPDLIKQVPNMTFTKTNFSGYSIQLRGIGTQAISVTTDPAVAVAFNDQPFIRNHFFEQEFFDVAQVQVLRGPQGTLYGRNATAGVVNITSAKPTDQFEAMASAEMGNYKQRRFEGMINLPIVDDRLAVRLAGEWTKRDGYTFNRPTNDHVDGRDLWSGRATIGVKPTPNLNINLVWEHFSEDDDRLRSAKQLCTTDPTPESVGGLPTKSTFVGWQVFEGLHAYLSQGCKMGSLYDDAAFGVPDPYSLPYFLVVDYQRGNLPYTSNRQSTNLREIDSELTPKYKAKNDTVQLNAVYNLTPQLTFTSDTGYNNDSLYSTQDYNRFASNAGVFGLPSSGGTENTGHGFLHFNPVSGRSDIVCDPQLGCSDKLLAMDLTQQNSWQVNQEFRLASDFSGPFNFSVGGNFMHYETMENYYVFINSMTMFAWQESGDGRPKPTWVDGVSSNADCLGRYGGFKYFDPTGTGGEPTVNACVYIDPNPITSLDGDGHNYFRSQNPYVLNSYAAFGEAYYNVSPDLKFTGGLRWTRDQKHFAVIPSQLLNNGAGYPSLPPVDQQWDAITGRAALNWTPKLDFTDQTLIFGSYARGYKAGGANPPGPVLPAFAIKDANPIHPLTFEPEYIDAFELGTKNTLFDGALTLNTSAFYYNYKGYQISEIVDRTAINLNFDAKVKGAEVEATWEPLPGLRFNASGGYEDARAADGESSVDLMDRTAGNTDWMVVRPFPTQASNCILPTTVIIALLQQHNFGSMNLTDGNSTLACSHAYGAALDPVTQLPYRAPTPGNPLIGAGSVGKVGGPTSIPAGYEGFNPLDAPNGGAGFSKDLSRHTLPNAPPFTLSAGAQYSMPISSNWAGTLRTDFYWQDDSWARIFNDNPYDRIRSYTNLNLTMILTNQDGWQVMGYIKNVLDTTAITGAFLNSDDSNLTTNVFLTDPRLIGLRVTKNW
jgi:outer membrane receptor protein involved in Fe transport